MIANARPGALPDWQGPWSEAEARGFEPRMGVNPNRISRPFGWRPALSGLCRERCLTCNESKGACQAVTAARPACQRVRADNVRATAGHGALSCPASARSRPSSIRAAIAVDRDQRRGCR